MSILKRHKEVSLCNFKQEQRLALRMQGLSLTPKRWACTVSEEHVVTERAKSRHAKISVRELMSVFHSSMQKLYVKIKAGRRQARYGQQKDNSRAG
jgi:hypothetical protein